MWWCSTPTLFYATPPPLSLGQKLSGPQGHEKHPGFGPSNRLRKPGRPKRRIIVNRDPFREIRFGKLFQRHVPLPGLTHPAVLPQKFHVSIVDCITNRPDFLLHRQPLDHLPGSAAAQSCSTRSARKTVSSSAPMATTSTRRHLAFNRPFPERGIVRPGPRRQGIGFASLRALDCSGPSLGDSLFMRERGNCNGDPARARTGPLT